MTSPAALLKLSAMYPKASYWITTHGNEITKMKDAAEEILKWVVGVK